MDNEFVIDDSGAPIILVRYPKSFTIDSYAALFERYLELCDKHRRIAWLIDMRDFDPAVASPALRRGAADVFARAKQKLLSSTICEARFTESIEVRGVLTAFDWLTAGKWPTENFGTRDAAEAWLKEQVSLSERRR